MTEQTVTVGEQARRRPGLATLTLALLPLLVLAGVIVLFLRTGGGLELAQPVPAEALTVERTILRPGSIELVVRNGGPEDLAIAQAVINNAAWPVRVSPSPTIPRLGKATVHLDYLWVEGEAYTIALFSENAVAFIADIPVAVATPQPGGGTLLSFTLIGLYVGVIPVYLGLFWFGALRRLGRRWMVFLLAFTAGLLVFLGLDAVSEALDQSARLAGPFQGIGLIGIGVVGTTLLLAAIAQRQVTASKGEESQRMALAYMIATGIGLHNLGEGLAIGAAYSVGEIALGTFLVVGFILQNITEGLGIIAPILRDRPRLRQLALMGLVGGFPAILGTWIGGFTPSPTLAVLFLAIGAGAVFEVVYEIARLIQKDTAKRPLSLTVFSGVLAGMLLLWVTGLLIK